ncbi:MAG: polyphosphate kinase 1 [Xanthomonadaceae bacterium]|nr:polyphosphate kinase 1 [Xanthomonadaceae bacterium]
MLHKRFLPTLRSLLTEPDVPFIHRDLSWLQFNERVLGESRQAMNPLLERAKFLSITATNLDEFFMIRLSSLNRSITALQKKPEESEKYLRLREIRSSILENVSKFISKQVESLKLLASELGGEKITIVRSCSSGEQAFILGEAIFQTQILHKLPPPSGFTPALISGLENLQIGVIFPNDVVFFIPKNLPSSYIAYDGESDEYFIYFIDDLIYTHLGNVFRFDSKPCLIRLTKDSDFTVDLDEHDSESVPDLVKSNVKVRDSGTPTRLQYSGEFLEDHLEKCITALKLTSSEVMQAADTLCLGSLWAAIGQIPDEIKNKRKLIYPPTPSMIPVDFRDVSLVFERLKERDYLLHHPYDSFDAYVNWIREVCLDPKVTRIEQTIYRMDALSPIIDLLKEAAKTKTVRVVIELRARFDELNNLALTDELTKAGVHIAFGFGKLKLHAKVTLITRLEDDGEFLYTHLSTGNYNSATARLYTDLAVITANQSIGKDARHFFDKVWDGEIPSSFKSLLVAPTQMHKNLSSLITKEIQAASRGEKARVFAKVNALVDEGIIEDLYCASKAGVKIDLVVRGACSLVPGVKGLSENIRVVSIVDRYLEHSRIYYFENSKALYLSSADWMPRNFFSRLEIAFPIVDSRIYQYITETIIPTYMSDSVKARELTPQGTWIKRANNSKKAKIRSQFYFEELAKNEYMDTTLNQNYLLTKGLEK